VDAERSEGDPLRLTTGTALVTGSVTGIGRAVARAMLKDGWRVVIHGPDAEAAREVAQELGALGAVAGDLSDPATPERLVADAVRLGHGLTGLVNNAADTARADIDSVTTAAFDRIMAVNARAPMLLIQAALPHMLSAGAARC
jgi:NAD(P)-dependent dehydrogenase (short-subunit alcohol dehydrogenase family)